jgi:muramoyltetrapeptide carboxypeptidase
MQKNKTGIAIIAPGGYAPDNDAVLRAVAELEAQNCRVYNYYQHSARFQRFGGDDLARLSQIEAAVLNPDVDIVIALRGGYGMSRLLPHIDFDRCAASGKCFVGHSDFTAFQLALLQKTSAISFAGPMICNDFTREDKSDFTLAHFWKCITKPDCTVEWTAQGNPEVDMVGCFWGGNLSMIAQLVGTRWMPRPKDGILFIEDVHEHPYRVERMLLHLYHAGVFTGQQALVLGDFSNYSVTEYFLQTYRYCLRRAVLTDLSTESGSVWIETAID